MAAVSIKIFSVACVVIGFVLCTVSAAPQYQLQPEGPHNLLDIETPNSFNYNSPLRQPDSLRSRPYFDFLSTLYRRDSAKNDLFRPYARTRRDVDSVVEKRQRRAIVFRPLFVYKQQQIRKEEVQSNRRRI